MPRLAVISSYDRLCGIANYVSRLVPQFHSFADVEVLPLDVDLLSSPTGADIIEGDNHIRGIASRLAEFDMVNIHVEHGLYGVETSQILRRLKILFGAAPALCLTLHWLTPKPHINLLDDARQAFKGDFEGIGRSIYRAINYSRLGKHLYGRYLRNLQQKKPICFITHNVGDRDRLVHEYGLSDVFDHPLAYLSPGDVEAAKIRSNRSQFAAIAHLPTEAKLYGVFGFMAPYKGFEVAIRALKHLGPEHHLAIFGDLAPTQTDTRYRDMLIEEARAIPSRVHFCGTLPDEQFLNAIAICDAVVMPYREVGLSSSGPISLALELGKRIVASRIKAFEGFSHYYPEKIEFFVPGDDRHLAAQLTSPANTSAINMTEFSPFQRNIDVYRRALLGLLNNASP
ncbi:MAG: hypothetical protein LCH61_01370 [Proteobacteria bacterium]|nr:hypothetical protein [Pseudomonadota bacterium]